MMTANCLQMSQCSINATTDVYAWNLQSLKLASLSESESSRALACEPPPSGAGAGASGVLEYYKIIVPCQFPITFLLPDISHNKYQIYTSQEIICVPNRFMRCQLTCRLLSYDVTDFCEMWSQLLADCCHMLSQISARCAHNNQQTPVT